MAAQKKRLQRFEKNRMKDNENPKLFVFPGPQKTGTNKMVKRSQQANTIEDFLAEPK